MKKMEKWGVVAIVALTLSAGAVNAQQPQGSKATPEQRAEKATAKMATELQLTEAQKTQVHTINLKYAQSMQSTQAQSRELREERKTQMQSKDNEIKAVLDETQKVKYEAMKAEMKADAKAKRAPRQ